LGEAIDQDMIALPIGSKMRMAGGLYVWEFERGSKALNVRVQGQLVLNTSAGIVQMALAGLGVTFLCEDDFEPHISQGRLQRVLQDGCPPFAGYHLYYPSRKQPSPAFSLVLAALRLK